LGIVIEVVAALYGYGAGIRERLPLDWLGTRLTPWTLFGWSGLAGGRDIARRSARRTRLGEPHLLALLAEKSLARQLDAVAFNAENLDQDLITFAKLVLDVLHAMLGDLAHVEQAVVPGKISTKAPNSARRTTLPR